MNRSEPNLGRAVAVELRRSLAGRHARIRHCLAQLTDAQVWWRPQPSLNSIGNLVLHLCGNVRQWVIAPVSHAADTRDRPAEFAERGSVPKDELLRRLDETVRAADAVLAGLTDEQWLQPRRVQGFDETVLSAVFDSVAHFHGHTQEIVSLTRMQRGDAYRFAWVPASPEQGA